MLNNRYIYTFIWLVVLIGMTCFSSNLFVDSYITPKWVCLISGIIMIILVNSLRIIINPQQYRFRVFAKAESMFKIFSVLTFFISLWGILQYINVLPSMRIYKVTGGFENPAGFSSALAIILPYVLYGWRSKEKYAKICVVGISILCLFAICVSTSRAGMVSIILIFILGGHKFIDLKKNNVIKFSLCTLLIMVLSYNMFIKIDSTSGRILIWRISWEIIQDNWLWGLGKGGFASQYMNYQASYLSDIANERLLMIADNIQHPFNEFILLWVDYGVFSIIGVIIILNVLIHAYLKDKSFQKLAAILSIASIVFFSMFSYPFKYPFTWFVFIYSSFLLVRDIPLVDKLQELPIVLRRFCSIIILGVSILLIHVMFNYLKNELSWNKIAITRYYDAESIQQYDKLYYQMKHNKYFMYNYAYALYFVGDYDKADKIIEECRNLWADYDVQLLSGLINMMLNKNSDAVFYFNHAINMCPNRFRPLFLKLKLYERQNDSIMIKRIAEQITTKPSKILSTEVNAIIDYAEQSLRSYNNDKQR